MSTKTNQAVIKSPSVEEHMNRMFLFGVVFGSVLHTAAVLSVWGDWSKVALIAAEYCFIILYNTWVNLWLTPRLGVERAESARILPNIAAVIFVGALIEWGLLFWLWLPYLVIINNGHRVTKAALRIYFYLFVISVFAVAHGASVLEAICFLGLSLYWHVINHEHIRFGRSVIDAREESLLEVAFAHDELSQRKEQLDKVNSEMAQHISELHKTQRQLIEASRKAGMADVATNVLHNVGNVLNSVNVSTYFVLDLVRASKTSSLNKALQLLEGQPDQGRFLSEDPRGKKLLEYIATLTKSLSEEQKKILEELGSLSRNIEHIKVIVSMQQKHTKAGGVLELLSLSELVEDSLKANEASQADPFELVRDYTPLPLIESDRHKLFQILMNLLSNARQAVSGLNYPGRITVRIRGEGGQVALDVEDNGKGIPPENIEKIFHYGFTTKKDGHGFGLHSCANDAKDLGGTLTVISAGLGQGATFTLRIPQKQSAKRRAA